MTSRRTTLHSAPLPECSRCSAPMRRARWALCAGVCSSCMTTPERFALAERVAHLQTLTAAGREETRRDVDERLERLAARRSSRAAGVPP